MPIWAAAIKTLSHHLNCQLRQNAGSHAKQRRSGCHIFWLFSPLDNSSDSFSEI